MMKRRFSNPRNRRGFWTADTIVAIGITTLLSSVLAIAVSRHHVGEQKLSDGRSAVRIAEHVLLCLQHNQAPPTSSEDVKITTRATSVDPTPAGYKWLTVDVIVNGRHGSLTGVVPQSEDPSGKK